MYPLPLDHSLTVVEIICDASNSSEIRVKMHGHSSKVHNQIVVMILALQLLTLLSVVNRQTDREAETDRKTDRPSHLCRDNYQK